MNGGTCLFFETVGEPACRWAKFEFLYRYTNYPYHRGGDKSRRRKPTLLTGLPCARSKTHLIMLNLFNDRIAS